MCERAVRLSALLFEFVLRQYEFIQARKGCNAEPEHGTGREVKTIISDQIRPAHTVQKTIEPNSVEHIRVNPMEIHNATFWRQKAKLGLLGKCLYHACNAATGSKEGLHQ